jgi:PTH1 family peptidyl-tRNA hydrolase
MKKKIFSNYFFGKGVFNGEEIFLYKPLTFMNRSGDIMKAVYRNSLCIQKTVVVCDNMDLFPGVVRLKKGGGSAGHNGLKSIIDKTGTDSFYRIYVGIGRAESSDRTVDHVLGIPSGAERVKYLEGTDIAARCILEMANTPPEKVMNEINRIKNIRNY